MTVDRRLASLWFGFSIRPDGWELPPAWDSIAGDYRAKDGWIKLHTNAPAHRAAALSVLGPANDRTEVVRQVEGWDIGDLESAIIEAGGCAAAMQSMEAWVGNPQGAAIAREPLVHWHEHGLVSAPEFRSIPARPLAGLRVLDCTRVLAGPVAGRFLAAYGAEVLRIDPPDWDEPGVVPEVTLGKRCAGLNLRDPADRSVFDELLSTADILLHGYRPGAMEGLGYGVETLRAINPKLVDVSLSAYGWSGPWATRRGFDSLVQMSTGIADYGMKQSRNDRPTPLPVQALDQATGYLLAASALHALRQRVMSGRVLSARLSLARVAHLLAGTRRDTLAGQLAPETMEDIDPAIESTAWGPARRVRFPLQIPDVEAAWRFGASALRSAPAAWEIV